MTDSSITPPPELVQQWYNECPEANEASLPYIATQAARWGANQELGACCEWLHAWTQDKHPGGIENLRAARRPKPPSLKEQALAVLENEPEADDMKDLVVFDVDQVKLIRRALEALPK